MDLNLNSFVRGYGLCIMLKISVIILGNPNYECWRKPLLQEVHQTINHILFTQFLRLFYEYSFYGNSSFSWKHPSGWRVRELRCYESIERKIFLSISSKWFLRNNLISGWPFCRVIVYRTQILICFQFWFPEVFPNYC